METKSYERSVNDKKFKKLRVLLIGDEEMVADVRDTLRRVGHDVITRESIEDAQELYEKELKKFDVVYHMVEIKRDFGIITPEEPVIVTTETKDEEGQELKQEGNDDTTTPGI